MWVPIKTNRQLKWVKGYQTDKLNLWAMNIEEEVD